MMSEALAALRERTRAAEALTAACIATLEPVAAALAPALREPVPRSLRLLAGRAERRLAQG